VNGNPGISRCGMDDGGGPVRLDECGHRVTIAKVKVRTRNSYHFSARRRSGAYKGASREAGMSRDKQRSAH
jgi:hypothetical protein